MLRRVVLVACRTAVTQEAAAASRWRRVRALGTVASDDATMSAVEEFNQEMEAVFGLLPLDGPLSSHSAARHQPSSHYPPSPLQQSNSPFPSRAPSSSPRLNTSSSSSLNSHPISARHVNSAIHTATGLDHNHDAQDTSSPASAATSASASASAPANPRLTHLDASGKASMVDVSGKAATQRRAVASAVVLLGPVAFALVASNQTAKGDVLTVAQIAGINGAKATSSLIPLCHNVPLSKVGVHLALDAERHAVVLRAEASTVGVTGVEMEALTAAAVAALTVYDMCKAVSKGIEIRDVRLEEKSGGKSGEWRRREEGPVGSRCDDGGDGDGGSRQGG